MRKTVRGTYSRGILCAWEASFHFVSQPAQMRCSLAANGGKINGTQAENRKDALAAGGRRACKELGMPVANHRSRLKHRHLGLDLHQHHCGSRNHDRRSRVHHDAQRAVVGIALQRMHVRHLRHSQQRHQDETHNRHRRQSAWPATERSADLCLQSCQLTTPALRISKLDANIPAKGPR